MIVDPYVFGDIHGDFRQVVREAKLLKANVFDAGLFQTGMRKL